MQLDVKAWFLSHFPRGKLTSRGDRIRNACPFHSDSASGGGSFVIFLPRGNWVCKADSCAKKGSFALLYKETENIAFWPDVYEKLKITNPITPEALNEAIYGSAVPGDIERVSPLPAYGLISVADRWPNYLAQRGYPPGSNIQPYGLCWMNTGVYRGCLVFPFWDESGDYKTFTARKMSTDKAEGRYFGPDGNTNDQYLYGAHTLRGLGAIERLVVVEGQFDVMRMWTYGEVTVGLSNKDATGRQLVRIHALAARHGCPIIVMLDGSAQKWTEQLTIRLSNYQGFDGQEVLTSSAFLPEGLDPDRSSYDLVKRTLDAVMPARSYADNN